MRWLISGRATRVQVEAGISQIADVLGNKYDTDLIALRLTREINRAQRFVLNATQGFDREIEYNFTNDSIVQGNGNYSIISPQVRKELDLTFTHTTSDGFNGNVRAFVFESEGVVQNSSEQQKGLVTTLSYPIHGLYSGNHRAILELLASKTYNEFNNSFSSVTENQVDLTELTFYQSLSSDLSYFVEFRFRQSDGSDSSSNYLGADSKSIAIGFRYAPNGRF